MMTLTREDVRLGWRVPLVKAAVRELTLPRARELAGLALRQPTAAAVREALEVV